MNLVPTPMCTFCGDHEETLEHLLISCAYTKTFWLSVISWLNTYNMKIDKLDEVTIVFGISDNNPGNCLLNPRGGEVLASIFAGFVPLASPNPYPIIICSVTNYRPHVSHLWANAIFCYPNLVTF